MESNDPDLFSALNQEIHFLRKIIFANRLHDPDCSAFTTLKGDSLFGSIGEKYCDCWISRNNPEPNNLKGFLIQERETSTVIQTLFRSRAEAVDFLEENHGRTRDKKSENYWQNSFYVVEGFIKDVKLVTHYEIWQLEGVNSQRYTAIDFPSRDEAIKYLTNPPQSYALNPMADNYWGFNFQIKESTGK